MNEDAKSHEFLITVFPDESERQAAPPHSHSMVLSHGNALIFQRKFFLRTAKNRLTDPSEIFALDFKHEFRRSAICSVSATIGINRSISEYF
jgi:hypothetical protein